MKNLADDSITKRREAWEVFGRRLGRLHYLFPFSGLPLELPMGALPVLRSIKPEFLS
jgi:hypothetical protein